LPQSKTAIAPSNNVISNLYSLLLYGEVGLARIIYKRNRIDPAKITGPYSLFAVMLLVAEILFAIWFCKADSSIERSIAGSIMAAVFVSLMLTIIRMNQSPDKKRNPNCSITSRHEK